MDTDEVVRTRYRSRRPPEVGAHREETSNARKKFGSAFTRHVPVRREACNPRRVLAIRFPPILLSSDAAARRVPQRARASLSLLPPYPGLRTVAHNVVPTRAVTTLASVTQIGKYTTL